MGKLTSVYLRPADAENLHEALLFADEQGYPLNLTITIKWEHFDGRYNPEYRLADAQERLRHSLIRRGHDLRWVWVREARFGAHHHLLAHNPFSDDGVTFDGLLVRALKPDGAPNADNAIVIKPVGTGQRGSGGNKGWWRYACKGLHPIHAAGLHITPSPQGLIVGKRTGMTENLNRAARMRALNARRTRSA